MARWRRRSFLAGTVALAVALLSPLDAMSGSLASAHMVQHLLLTTIAAPLLVLGVRWRVLIAGLPPAVRRRTSRWRRTGVARAGRAVLAHPVVASLPFVAALWVWHAEGPYEAALANTYVHGFEHAVLPGHRAAVVGGDPRSVASQGGRAGHGGARPVRACHGERPARCAPDIRPGAVVPGLRRHDSGLGAHPARGPAAGGRHHVGARRRRVPRAGSRPRCVVGTRAGGLSASLAASGDGPAQRRSSGTGPSVWRTPRWGRPGRPADSGRRSRR